MTSLPLPTPFIFEPVLLMIAPNYVSLSFSLYTVKMLPKADCLLCPLQILGCHLKHNLMIVYYHPGLSAVSLPCRLLLFPGEIMKRGRLPSSSEDSDDNGSKACFVVLGAYQGLGQFGNMIF